MKENFKPDYGIWAKENLPAADVFFFYNLQIKEIFRIDKTGYSLFTTYRFEGTDYALSLDFIFEQLPDLIQKIEPYFNYTDFETIVYQLIDPEFKSKVVEWNAPISGIDIEAELGELEINQNEQYVPFQVIKFL